MKKDTQTHLSRYFTPPPGGEVIMNDSNDVVCVTTDFSAVKLSTLHQRQLMDTERVFPSQRFDTCTRIQQYTASFHSG